MEGLSKIIREAVANQSGAMEADTISNGRSLKNLMSKGNVKFNLSWFH